MRSLKLHIVHKARCEVLLKDLVNCPYVEYLISCCWDKSMHNRDAKHEHRNDESKGPPRWLVAQESASADLGIRPEQFRYQTCLMTLLTLEISATKTMGMPCYSFEGNFEDTTRFPHFWRLSTDFTHAMFC